VKVLVGHVLIYTIGLFYDWFDFVLSSVWIVLSWFLAEICLHSWNKQVKDWKLTFGCWTAWSDQT